MKFLFICDFSEKIGLGHLNRCLNFANFLVSKNYECIFYSIDSNFSLLKKFKISKKIKFFGKDKKKISKDNLSVIKNIISDYLIDIVVIDNYNYTYYLQRKITKFNIFTICIADYPYRKYYCNFLINPNSPKKFINEKKNSFKISGNEYSFIEDNFFQLKKNNIVRSNEILIYLGSYNEISFLRNILQRISRNLPYKPIFKLINKKKIKFKNIKYLKFLKTKNLIREMDRSDIVISAGGTFLIKSILRQKFTIAINTNNNQNENLRYLVKKKFIFLIKKKYPFFKDDKFKKNYFAYQNKSNKFIKSLFINSKKKILTFILKQYKKDIQILK